MPLPELPEDVIDESLLSMERADLKANFATQLHAWMAEDVLSALAEVCREKAEESDKLGYYLRGFMYKRWGTAFEIGLYLADERKSPWAVVDYLREHGPDELIRLLEGNEPCDPQS